MLIHGYCQSCHKIKRVKVSVPLGTGVQIGTCPACAEKEAHRGR